MSKFCAYCGKPKPDQDLFCSECGARDYDQTKTLKQLTIQQIHQDLKLKRPTVGDYMGVLVWSVIDILLATYLSPTFWLFIPLFAVRLIQLIIESVKMRSSWYVIVRPCIEKNVKQDDEGDEHYHIWFSNKDGSLYVSQQVDKDFFEKTNLGDEFYLVFLNNSRTPSLHYKKTEWIQSGIL